MSALAVFGKLAIQPNQKADRCGYTGPISACEVSSSATKDRELFGFSTSRC
jgi:hypothetical protein